MEKIVLSEDMRWAFLFCIVLIFGIIAGVIAANLGTYTGLLTFILPIVAGMVFGFFTRDRWNKWKQKSTK